jgi:hypothetical protein
MPGFEFTDSTGCLRRLGGITTMERWPTWKLARNGRVLATSRFSGRQRLRVLRLLVGRRLMSVALDRASNSTRLTFTMGFRLETRTEIVRLRRTPH